MTRIAGTAMSNIERFNKYSSVYERGSTDVYNDGKYSITRQWLIGENGKRIPYTTVFAVYEDDDGDFPLFSTMKEARTFLTESVKEEN